MLVSHYFWSLISGSTYANVVIPHRSPDLDVIPQKLTLQLNNLFVHLKSIVVVYRAKMLNVSMSQYLWTWLYMKYVNYSQNLHAFFRWGCQTLLETMIFTCSASHSSDSQVFFEKQSRGWEHTLWSQFIHPCRCLCLGWDLQKTNSLPRRRTKKQSLQRLLRAVLVFMPADGWIHRSCWHRPSSGERNAVCGSYIRLTTPLNCAVAAVMVEMHLCAPNAGKEPKAAHLATWANCRVKEPTRQGSSSGAMVSTPSEKKQVP